MCKPVVSIICNTYNHEEYIKDALDGFVMQKTDFPFEILIHDDASTDNTKKIIEKYVSEYPGIIKPVYQTENKFSQKINIFAEYQLPRVSGNYIAFCEGDDYWIDPLKLQKQVDAFKSNPNINLCAHSTIKVRESDKKTIKKIAPRKSNTIITVEDVIMGGGGFFSTNSLMVRKEVIIPIPQVFIDFPLDYTLQILGSLDNGALYLSECMSVYRYLSKPSLTLKIQKDLEYRKFFYNYVMDMLLMMDSHTNGKYHEQLIKKYNAMKIRNFIAEGEYDKVFDNENKEYIKYLLPKERQLLYARRFCSWAYSIYKKLKN